MHRREVGDRVPAQIVVEPPLEKRPHAPRRLLLEDIMKELDHHVSNSMGMGDRTVCPSGRGLGSCETQPVGSSVRQTGPSLALAFQPFRSVASMRSTAPREMPVLELSKGHPRVRPLPHHSAAASRRIEPPAPNQA